jgi:hypothetical protein
MNAGATRQDGLSYWTRGAAMGVDCSPLQTSGGLIHIQYEILAKRTSLNN